MYLYITFANIIYRSINKHIKSPNGTYITNLHMKFYVKHILFYDLCILNCAKPELKHKVINIHTTFRTFSFPVLQREV